MPAVLVTGASSGIGEACAGRLARHGWDVIASVREAGQAPEGTRELVFDITDDEAVREALRAIGDLDAVVANAGIAVAAPLELLTPDELRRQLDVNVVGQLRVVQGVIPALRAASRGRIVLMGSIGGRSALPFIGAYAMSKFALEAFADALRVELAPWGIDVAIVEPGSIATAIWTKRQRPLEDYAPQAVDLYGARAERFRKLAAARATHGVSPDEVARAVEHALTSRKPRTRYVVGPDAKKRARLERLPDRVRDRLLTRFLFGS